MVNERQASKDAHGFAVQGKPENDDHAIPKAVSEKFTFVQLSHSFIAFLSHVALSTASKSVLHCSIDVRSEISNLNPCGMSLSSYADDFCGGELLEIFLIAFHC